MISERQLALDIILQVTEEGEYLNRVLDDALTKYEYLKKEQRAFITRAAVGTVEKKLTLDHVISLHATTPMQKMDPVIRGILRLSACQILYMDKIPDSASCNEAVKLAEKNRKQRLKGFVNGVLRSICRNKDDLLASLEKMARPTSSISSRSKAYSLPEWILQMWEGAYGRERATELCRGLMRSEPQTTIRVNTLKTTVEEYTGLLKAAEPQIRIQTDEELPYALHLSGYDRITALPGYEEGIFYVQNRASMMPVALSQCKPGDTCIDVCAAPGGKTLQLIQLMEGRGMVYSRDVSSLKTDLIGENLRRFLPDGLPQEQIVTLRVQDALEEDVSLREKADVVIADLPCSGLGVMAHKPDIRYRVTEEDVKSLAALQHDMLDVVCRYTKCGGKLVFSTCTVTPYENERNAERFAAEHENFRLLEMRQLPPVSDWQDGFFIALFQRLS